MRKFGTRVAIIPLLLLFFLAASLIFSPALHAQATFYQGKSIRLIIGSQAGSLYDGWARLFASHMGKHIAGNPAIDRAKHGRRRFGDRGKSNLQRCQTGWAHSSALSCQEFTWTSSLGERKCSSTGRDSVGSGHRSKLNGCSLPGGIALTKASKIYARPKNRRNAAPRGQARFCTLYPSLWKRAWEQSSL